MIYEILFEESKTSPFSVAYEVYKITENENHSAVQQFVDHLKIMFEHFQWNVWVWILYLISYFAGQMKIQHFDHSYKTTFGLLHKVTGNVIRQWQQ